MDGERAPGTADYPRTNVTLFDRKQHLLSHVIFHNVLVVGLPAQNSLERRRKKRETETQVSLPCMVLCLVTELRLGLFSTFDQFHLLMHKELVNLCAIIVWLTLQSKEHHTGGHAGLEIQSTTDAIENNFTFRSVLFHGSLPTVTTFDLLTGVVFF